MDILPRELRFKIISKLDIDARRKLGVYTSLRIPDSFKFKLGSIPRIRHFNENYIVDLTIPNSQKVYRLIRSFDLFDKILDYRVFLERKSSISSFLIWHIFEEDEA